MAFNFEFVLKIVQIETNHKGFYRVYVIYVSETENMCSTKIISLLSFRSFYSWNGRNQVAVGRVNFVERFPFDSKILVRKERIMSKRQKKTKNPDKPFLPARASVYDFQQSA